MNIQILKDEKHELEITIDNQTVAEILRVYLNMDHDVKMAAWKKEHYSKPIRMKIVTEGKTAKKALSESISKLKKDLDKVSDDFKKSK